MPITLTSFSPGVLTAAQLNAIVNAIVAKFNGQITKDDMLWPFKAGGDLDMVQYEILHLSKLWNIRNLAERDTATTLQDVYDDVDSDGGGVVLLPADSTETVGTGGVTIGANTVTIGAGESSVFNTSGTLTNHMFRNKANGNSSIWFMSCKLDNSGASGGNFDIAAMQRTIGARFLDCILVVNRRNGITLKTDSSGSSTTKTLIHGCRFTVQGTGLAGVLMTDVQDAKVVDCSFQLDAGTAVQFTANGATSNADLVLVNDNTVSFPASSTADQAFVLDGPATNGFRGLQACNNVIDAGANAVTHILQVSGATSGVLVNSNTIRGTGGATSCIRFTTSTKFTVSNNVINVSGAGTLGILIGATARGGTASACTAYTCSGNEVTTNSSNFVFCHPGAGSNFGGAVVTGNNGVGTTEANYEIWGLDGDPTSYTMRFTAVGNHASGPVTANWACYQDRGSSTGGRAGNAVDSWLIVQNNIMAGATIGNSAGDFFRESDLSPAAGSRRCLTDPDDAGNPVNNLR